MLCRYATHMFEPLHLPDLESDGLLASSHASKEAASGLATRELSRHDSKLTAMMDDQPDEDYWWGSRNMQRCMLSQAFAAHSISSATLAAMIAVQLSQ